MPLREQLDLLLKNIAQLGARRIALAGGLLAVLIAGLAVSAVYLNRPAYETLYVGLERDDISRIGIALTEAGMDFDVDSNGSTVMVKSGSAGQARMVLAEKGLPASSGAGYELFDQLGSLGLTSFMQEVTRVRALEGEIARSVQSIDGVKAARIHIVIPDKSSFRDRDKKATASILVRADSNLVSGKAVAIRHLVAAAVPGLATEDVTVLDSEGNLLTSGADQSSNSLASALEMQRIIENSIEEKISKSIGAQLGVSNYRVSVQARINTDDTTTQETVFDPASRVERSVQVARAEDSSTQKPEAKNTSVEQNLPNAPSNTEQGPLSSEKSQKREETTNYEINSKHTESKRNGYRIERLSISVAINRKTLTAQLGKNPPKNALDLKLAEIQKMASAAAGYEKERGDQISINAADFFDDTAPVPPDVSIWESLTPYVGTTINATAFVVVAFAVLFLGIRPLIKVLAPSAAAKASGLEASPATSSVKQLSLEGQTARQSDAADAFQLELNSIKPNLMTKTKVSPSERLKAMAELDAERSAKVVRKWLLEEAA